MPKPLWIYLIALLHFTKVSTCSTIAEIFPKASHDRLTRMLNGDWSGQTLLELAIRTLFVWERGYLIIDDTVLARQDCFLSVVLPEDVVAARELVHPATMEAEGPLHDLGAREHLLEPAWR